MALKTDKERQSVVFAGLPEASNLGDRIIFRCAQEMYLRTLIGSGVRVKSIETLNLAQPRSMSLWVRTIRSSFHLIRRFISSKFGSILLSVLASFGLKRECKNKINTHSLVIIVGGGLIKYKYEHFWLYLSILMKVASARQARVIFNAVGVEGFDASDFRCRCLRRALQMRDICAITTRDDLNTLTRDYLPQASQVFAAKTPDPAVCAGLVYGYTHKASSKTIGVGLVRTGIFLDNDCNVTATMLEEFYFDLVQELERRGMSWEMFTNGLGNDAEIGNLILQSKPGDHAVVEPSDDAELVGTIGGFGAVIAPRLHANIVAYSLGIPSVGICWNRKLEYFGRSIGHPERFLRPPLVAEEVVASLCRAITEGTDEGALERQVAQAHADIASCLQHTHGKTS